MLVSHRHKFIFTKTFKTAGTTIEHYFEPYCLPDELKTTGAQDQEIVSTEGIVGKRGTVGKRHRWHAHMSAAQIKEQLELSQWESYTKFSIVRNPFDKMVSAYFFLLKLKESQGTLTGLKNRIKVLLGRNDSLPPGSHEDHRINFRNWIKGGAHFNDDVVYQIDGQSILDYTMQYEHLQEHLEELCSLLRVPYEANRLKTLKSGYRSKAFSIDELYDDESIALVAERYSGLIHRFGYSFPREG